MFIVAQVFGFIGMVILLVSFQINKKSKLLKLQILSSLMFCLQFLCLNAYSGFYMNLMTLTRNYIYSKYKDRVPTIWVVLIILMMIGLSLISYNGFISILPCLAVVIFTVSLTSSNLLVIRIGDIISCSLFLIYNFYVMAYAGVVATILELLFTVVAVIRFDFKKN